jgi:hypothetical protein
MLTTWPDVQLKPGECPRCKRPARFRRMLVIVGPGATRRQRLMARLKNALFGRWRRIDECECDRRRRRPRPEEAHGPETSPARRAEDFGPRTLEEVLGTS